MGGGCWTCRARRKKCDGLKPSCDSCERLGIRRGGFGATKPSWMDNGAEQQRYCQDIKNQIKMQKRVRSKSNGNSKHPHLNQTRDEVIHDPPQVDPMSIEDSHMLNLSSLLQENETMPSLFGLDFDENFFSFLDSVSPTSIFRQTFAIESSDLDRAFESSPVEREISAYAVLGPDIESVLVMQYFDHMFYQIFDTYCRAVQDPVRGLLSLMAGRSPSLRQTLMSVACARRNVRTPQPDVFFQEPSFKDVFTGSENTSQAYYQRAVNLHNDFVQEIGSGNRWLDTRNLNSYLDALACLIHFIFLERIGVVRNVSAKHIEEASWILGRVKFLVDKEDFDTVIDSEMSNVMADSNASGRKCISRASEKRLVQTFSDILVRWKIIMGASSGQSLDLGSLLSEGVSVENDFTAESKASLTHLSQAFLLVNQVTKLRLWKLNLVNQGLLSTLELARRAGDIERELKAIEDYSRTLEHSGSRVTPCWAGFRSTSKVASSHACDWHTLLSILRSRLFAVAGKIYLHIVVSGPNFNLPEIRANVEVGMSDIYRLKALAEDQLISIAWPLCVIGCMVSPELMTKGRTPMREWLSEILRNTAETHFYLGDVLKVAEKCWEALDSGSNTDDCVWMGEVNKVNCNTVLI